ncbi:uncharacterized protein LOC116342614 isoform X4 [Contarinia nasturtii]|uniref:uncharacterized protein LOC116342614 isoform X4 n=1 Tax=Contarinia nasturtii TaxID=265458 RepID=UPI0012D3D683|nr:uncharacterized protein LOC116342614 isoform X4 [Contarinia nasturtii]
MNIEISHLNMAGDAEQTDSSGKYTFGGGSSSAKKYWPTILKSIELVLCLLCLVLIDDPAHNSRIHVFVSQRTVSFVYVTFGSYLIYTLIFLIGKLIRDEWPWKTASIFACVAVFLFLVCGFLLLKNWSDTKERNIWPPNTTRLDLLCASGFISIITAITFLVDAILMIRAGNRGEFEY